MIILGIDPGSQLTGYGLIQKEGSRFTHIDNGAIVLTDKESFPLRLKSLFEKIGAIIDQFHPELVSLENIFYAKNVQSTVKLGHARGTIMVACALKNLPIVEYTPLEIKKAVVGYGQASKDQVQKMVKALLHLPQVAEENASDALAAALCGGQGYVMENLLKGK